VSDVVIEIDVPAHFRAYSNPVRGTGDGAEKAGDPVRNDGGLFQISVKALLDTPLLPDRSCSGDDPCCDGSRGR
jgi:hypothetical protein